MYNKRCLPRFYTNVMRRYRAISFWVYLTIRLEFDHHIFNLRNKLSRGCIPLRVVTRELDSASARNLYFALIASQLRDGICFFGSCSDKLFNSVFIVQKRALRILCRRKSIESCTPLFATTTKSYSPMRFFS